MKRGIKPKIIKKRLSMFLSSLIFGLSTNLMAAEYTVYYDLSNHELQTVAYGAEQIQKAVSEIDADDSVKIKSIDQFSGNSDDSFVFELKPSIGVESYTLTRDGSFYKCEGDRVGLMYAALEIAESIRNKKLDSLDTSTTRQPYLEKRGLKMNIPLDGRTPSYGDCGTLAQSNIPEVWSMEFWEEQLNAMAKNRYNTITLWNLQPFPSMIEVPGFEEASLQNIMAADLDWVEANDKYDTDGTYSYTPYMEEHMKVIKEMTMEQKEDFWYDVMELAYNRGIGFHIYTWNIFTSGAGGKAGLPTEYQLEFKPGWRDRWTKFDDEPEYFMLRDYYKEAVKAMLARYPRLAGFGITTGEGFGDDKREATHEEAEYFLGQSYGLGVYEYFNNLPNNHKDKDRHIHFVHRAHQANNLDDLIWENFSDIITLDNVTLDYSTKYANARLHSYAGKDQAKGKYDVALEDCPLDNEYGGRWWLNLRNDSIFTFRWGNYEFSKTFLEWINLDEEGNSLNGENPALDSIRGFHMGPDGAFMGRESLSKKPLGSNSSSPRQIEHDKSWYRYMLWGRLGYDIYTSEEIFEAEAQHRLGISNQDILIKFMKTWHDASEIMPAINRSYYKSLDYHFHPEYNIKDKRGDGSQSDPFIRYTSWDDNADEIQSYVDRVFENLEELKSKNYGEEYQRTLDDIEAWAELGGFYADWIRTTSSSDSDGKKAAEHWRNYTKIGSQNYIDQILGRLAPVSFQGFYDLLLNDLKYPSDVNRLPEVSLDKPTDKREFLSTSTFPIEFEEDELITVEGSASDEDGSVVELQILANGVVIKSEANNYINTNVTLSSGRYILELRAFDDDGDFGSTYCFILIKGNGVDTTPNVFEFTEIENVELSEEVLSNPILVTGIDVATTIEISSSNGTSTYLIDGVEYFSAAMVENGQSVQLKTISSSDYSDTVSSTLNIGGVEARFDVTTKDLVGSTELSFQAENYSSKSGGFTTDHHSGYTGSGYYDMGSEGTWFEWSDMNISALGEKVIKITYSLGASTSRPCTILINGTDSYSIDLNSTSGWSRWNSINLNVDSTTGINSIRVIAGENGGPNIDKIDIEEIQPLNNLYEAESAKNIEGSSLESKRDGYTGTGYVDMGDEGSYVEWDNIQSNGGSTTLGFTYALRKGIPRPCDVMINEIIVGRIDFVDTKSWDLWETLTFNTELRPGINKIRLIAGQEGGPNLDGLIINP